MWVTSSTVDYNKLTSLLKSMHCITLIMDNVASTIKLEDLTQSEVYIFNPLDNIFPV